MGLRSAGATHCHSHGLDWIKDFSRFVTLLADLQRFDRGNWGFHHELEPDRAGPLPKPPAENLLTAIEATNSSLIPRPALKNSHRSPLQRTTTTEMNLWSPMLEVPSTRAQDLESHKSHFTFYTLATLLGRATRVERVTITRGGVPVPRKWVLKVAWPESTRVSEVEILDAAAKIGEKDNNVRGHLPKLLCSKDLECTTAVIREVFGLREESEEKQACCGPRTPRLIVFEELHGIETLSSDELLKAFRDVVDCHYALWIGGIRHCDISPGNLMWNPVKKSGVLNDYDLSRMNSVTPSPNLERTGTIPFLSLDLLQNNLDLRQGDVEPTYKHDCDSLKWVFLYVCCVEKGSVVCRWLTPNIQTSIDFRVAYLGSLLPFRVSRKHETLHQHGKAVCRLLQVAYFDVWKHNVAFDDGAGPKEYIGATDFDIYNALKSSIHHGEALDEGTCPEEYVGATDFELYNTLKFGIEQPVGGAGVTS